MVVFGWFATLIWICNNYIFITIIVMFIHIIIVILDGYNLFIYL